MHELLQMNVSFKDDFLKTLDSTWGGLVTPGQGVRNLDGVSLGLTSSFLVFLPINSGLLQAQVHLDMKQRESIPKILPFHSFI